MIKIYNTLTGKKEIFEPVNPGHVLMYVCGPTVYDFIHIGNARTFMTFDIIKRYLQYRGFHVFHVQNITDVGHLVSDADYGDDKIIKRALREKLEPMQLVEKYIQFYLEDIDALGITRADIMPRATGHIIEMLDAIKILLDKKFAYEVEGDVFFDILKFPDYGALSKIKIDELKAGSRVEINPKKRNPLDFALWKKADPRHIMQWTSPWGKGYPGWHIECSVMATKYLGDEFDIHGGGKDLKFPHHENEIAQAKACSGGNFARYWVHSEFITINGKKMSKSKGNFLTAREVIRQYGADTVRMLFLSTHYRSLLDFNKQNILNAKKNIESLYKTFNTLHEKITPETETQHVNEVDAYKTQFVSQMDNDFNTPGAIATIFKLASYLKKNLDKIPPKGLNYGLKVFIELTSVLGFTMQPKKVASHKILDLLIDVRNKLRATKNYEVADYIRNKLEEKGIILEDTKGATIIKYK